MEIAVCVCLVPDTASVIGFQDGRLDMTRVSEVMNPYDEYALEEALRMREGPGGGVVRVFSVASPEKKELLRKSLAMGADRLVIVEGPATPDPWQTASALRDAFAEVYGDSMPDMVFCGRRSTDFGSGEVPGMLAALLGMPSVSAVVSLDVAPDGSFLLVREIEGGAEHMSVGMPVLFSTEKGLNIPRKTSMKGVMEARKKPVDILPQTETHAPRAALSAIRPAVKRKPCHMLDGVDELVRRLNTHEGLF
ncbi:electron transfer flavoprotein subunit beta/FixA family protein [Pelodictyon luteolum]|uniref:Electron transfer flavoprotein beta subunit n=1 Tax=Chlorobium luteolum (strain DSM 273 / BCRC 81028 / 2530) TaxID=319225 RepID=Q3B222_CHLL3|nr:electron transfer flavoprotein subunit beta/FixA family protein [Pelodictyon luteolum]ABB24609.1 electron transfer flavoprotein beta subunit [Pelodictyon luteolum DSM 273]